MKIAMIAGTKVGFSRKPTKMSAAITAAITAPVMPHGLTYGGGRSGTSCGSMTNEIICSR
jgi:hypothetical protein